jgi:hypothetical protein
VAKPDAMIHLDDKVEDKMIESNLLMSKLRKDLIINPLNRTASLQQFHSVQGRDRHC